MLRHAQIYFTFSEHELRWGWFGFYYVSLADGRLTTGQGCFPLFKVGFLSEFEHCKECFEVIWNLEDENLFFSCFFRSCYCGGRRLSFILTFPVTGHVGPRRSHIFWVFGAGLVSCSFVSWHWLLYLLAMVRHSKAEGHHRVSWLGSKPSKAIQSCQMLAMFRHVGKAVY